MAQEYLDIIGRDKATPVIDKIGRSLGTLAKFAGVAFGTREIFQAVGAYQDFSNKIKNATNASQDFARTQNQVFQIATQNGRSLAETANLYSALQLVTQDAGFAGNEFNNFIKTINNSLKINNTSTQDAAALTDNLSKAFVKGTIDGRDFTQLLNANRNVVERLAAATGKSIPELAKIARDTGIPVQALTLALQATEESAEKLAQTTDLKLSSALTIAGNNATKFFGELDKATGVTTLLGKAIILVSDNLGVLITGFGTFFALVTVVRLTAITRAMNLFMASLIPGGAVIRGVILGVTALASGLAFLLPKLKGSAESAVDAADGFMSADDSMNQYGNTIDLIKEKQEKLNLVTNTKLAAEAKAALEIERYKKFEEFYDKQVQSLVLDEQGKLFAEARLAIGKNEVLNAQELLRIKELQNIADLKKAQGALPGIISETGGAFNQGSAEEKAFQEKIANLEILRKLDADNEAAHYQRILILTEEYNIKKRLSQQKSIADMAKDALAGNMSREKLANLDSDTQIAVGKAMFGELLGEASKYSEKAFKANKALALANAVVKGYEAITSAYAQGAIIGGPVLGAIFAALTAIAVKGQINAIRNTQYTGARRQGGLVGENQSYLVGESGPEMFTPNSSGRITPNDQMGQGVTVNFNISTVDADGFDQILINRRSTIVGIINEATNKRGRVGATQ